MEQQPLGPQRNALYQSIASAWGNIDPKAALEWARRLPATEGLREASRGLIYSLGNKDPEAAAKYVSDLPRTMRIELSGTVASQWARRDPAAAAEHFRTLLALIEDTPANLSERVHVYGSLIDTVARTGKPEEARVRS